MIIKNVPQPINNPTNKPSHLRNLHPSHSIDLQTRSALQHPETLPQLTHPDLPQIPQQPPHRVRILDIVARMREQQMPQLKPMVRQRGRLRARGVRVFQERRREL